VSRDFLYLFFSSNNSSWDMDPRVKAFFNIDTNSPRNSTLKSPTLLSTETMVLLTAGVRCQGHR
jgi:hypothetical protein